MADISKIQIQNGVYDIKDVTARNNLENFINNEKKFEKFKPVVYASMYMLDHTTDVIKERILKWKKMGCYGIIVLINFNSSLNLVDDLSKVLELMNYAKNNGLIVNTLKFHAPIDSNISVETLTTYETQLNYVLSQLNASDFGIKRIAIFNELNNVTENSSVEIKNKAISIINGLQNAGYQVTIPVSNLEYGLGRMIYYSPTICNNLDFFSFNYYQSFQFKKELTTEEDSIFAWSKSLDATYNYLEKYPTKSIVLSETGCLNNWQNMIDPSDYTLNQFPANGKTYPKYFYGLFKNPTANTNLKEVWLFYDEVLTNYDDVIDFFKHYLGGVNNE